MTLTLSAEQVTVISAYLAAIKGADEAIARLHTSEWDDTQSYYQKDDLNIHDAGTSFFFEKAAFRDVFINLYSVARAYSLNKLSELGITYKD